MHQQTYLSFYKLRFFFATVLALVFVVLLSAFVTAVGSHTVVDTRTNPSAQLVDTTAPDTPNAVTLTAYTIANDTHQATLSTGIGLYSACRSITLAAMQSGKDIAHTSAVVMQGVGGVAAYVAHGVVASGLFTLHAAGNTVMFVVRIPGKIIGSIVNTKAAGAVIRPADYNPTPVINTTLSSAVLARLSAQAQLDQRKNAALQSAQLVANRELDGTVVAGDPRHGGYPTTWDAPTPEDNMVDSWGMYNRECVSYTAWKVYQTYGHMPYWGGVGNANQWVGDAQSVGIPTGSIPKVHSVAISMRGYYGHAMWVEAVSGNMIYVSQYNYDLDGHYSEMWVSASYFTYIYFS